MISKCGCDLTTEAGRQAYVEKRKQERAEKREQKRLAKQARDSEARKRDYQRNPEKYRAAARTWRKNNDYSAIGKRYHLKRTYGITIEDRDSILANQGGVCKICAGGVSQSRCDWHVDHDHNKQKGEPGLIRGILCHMCNPSLGGFRHSPDLLRAAAKYLEDAANTDNVTPRSNYPAGVTQWL